MKRRLPTVPEPVREQHRRIASRSAAHLLDAIYLGALDPRAPVYPAWPRDAYLQDD